MESPGKQSRTGQEAQRPEVHDIETAVVATLDAGIAGADLVGAGICTRAIGAPVLARPVALLMADGKTVETLPTSPAGHHVAETRP